MARLITKFKYMKSGTAKKSGGYARYIATREGVEKLDDSRKKASATDKQKQLIQKLLQDFPDSKDTHEYQDYMKNRTIGNASEFISRVIEDNNSEISGREGYAKYIALRPRAERVGSHGLFTDDGVEVNLSQVADEMNRHKGNIWTIIISLHREDAERLGFNTGERWRTMLRTQTANLSENFKIPMKNLRWYAAFHNESHHPHVHMMVYSANEKEGYLSKQGIENLRSVFAKDIFMQDLYCIYEKQTEYRDKIRSDGKKIISDIVSEINAESTVNPHIQTLLIQLAKRLSRTTGKKVYGYLKPEVKSIVDMILTELSKDEWIQKLYDLWYQQKENALKIYTEAMPQRIPLVSNNEFKSIKNAIIQEALKIRKGDKSPKNSDENGEKRVEVEEDIPLPMPPEYDVPTPPPEYSGEKKTWWTEQYKKARSYLYGDKEHESDFEKAMELLKSESENGNGFAAYDLGKMYLSRLGCEKDEVKSWEMFEKAYQLFIEEEPKEKNPSYLQYRIGKLYAFGHGIEQDHAKAAEWYRKAVEKQNSFAAYALAGLYSRGQGVKKSDEKAFELYTISATDIKKPNAYAQYELGKMYRDGIGTSVDEKKSKDWFKKSYQGFLKIEQDMADDKLYYRLGQMNFKGIGTEIDLQKAKEYFEKAVKLGNDNAMFSLGKMYFYGNGVEEDFKKALEYLKKSADNGNVYAQKFLENMDRNRNYYATMGALSLLKYLGKTLQDKIDDNKIVDDSRVDRKLYRKIQDKKQAHGLKQ